METIQKIDPKCLPALGRVFTPVVMDSLIQRGTSGYLKEVMKNSGLLCLLDTTMSLYHFFDWVYDFLFRNYRNEYIYKNVIANNILLGKHSLNTSHMLAEFRVGKCKADTVVLNGTSTVYEIKSEFDSFSRLDRQIHEYLKIFDHIYVITSLSNIQKLEEILPIQIGILALTNRRTITTVRKSISNKENIKLDILFNSLRKKEYLKIIIEYFDTIPNVPNTLIFRKCKELFCTIPAI